MSLTDTRNETRPDHDCRPLGVEQGFGQQSWGHVGSEL